MRVKGEHKQPTDRFYIAFKVLTEVILPGAATPSELEGLNQRTVNAVAEGVQKVGGEATKERQMAETKAAMTGRATDKAEAKRLREDETRRRRDAATKAIEAAKSETAEKKERKRVVAAAKKARPKKAKKLPTIEIYAMRFIDKCRAMDSPYTKVLNKASPMLEHIDALEDGLAERIAVAIERMVESNAKRALNVAAAFRAKNRKRISALLNS
jgi:hypothetical protein